MPIHIVETLIPHIIDINKLTYVMSINMLGLITPGASMALLINHSIANGRKTGLMTAIGLTLGDLTHILLIILGITSMISNGVVSLTTLKFIGCAYLIFLGYKTIKNVNNTVYINKEAPEKSAYHLRAFLDGLLTSFTNPSVLLFFSSIYLIILEEDTTPYELFYYSASLMLMTIIWLSLTAVVASSFQTTNKTRCLVQRTIGGILIFFGINFYFTFAG